MQTKMGISQIWGIADSWVIDNFLLLYGCELNCYWDVETWLEVDGTFLYV